MAIRSPIVSVLGHVDHGKSSILDSIRGSDILSTEAGAITQAIGASIIPLDTIQKKCGALLKGMKMDFTIPGLLFIDTPGHAAFTSLRKRGGTLADIAIVVIDINEGFRPQTVEAIEILRASKTPFIIAANKIDLVPGWRKHDDNFLKDLSQQEEKVRQLMDQRIYELLAQLHERFSLECDRFDRVDYTRQVAVVPVSAKQHVGIPELLMVITGMAQRFLENNLKVEVLGPAKAAVLEVKEEKGLGTTLDVIVYDGTLKANDIIVIGDVDEPIVTKVRALLLPNPLHELRDKKAKYQNVKQVHAATGVKVNAPGIKDVVAGMPLRAASCEDLESVKQSVREEVQDVLVETDKEGIIIKGDTLGSLEAMIKLLREKDICIRKASVGPISKKDVSDAEAERDPFNAVILGFNIPEVETTDKVKIITSPIIYELLDRLVEWREQKSGEIQARELDELVRPAKIEVLRNCIFRQSNPCIVGIEVLGGSIKPGTPITKDGKHIGHIKSLQCDNASLKHGEKGKQCAASIPEASAGRQIIEEDILFADVPEDHFRRMKKLAKYLSGEEKGVLKEFAEIKRRDNVLWGV